MYPRTLKFACVSIVEMQHENGKYSPNPFENGVVPWNSDGMVNNQIEEELPIQAVMPKIEEDPASKTEINVDVQVTPNFQINGENNNEENIVSIIKGNMKELADEIGGELAEKLKKVFSNMPLKG